MTTCRCRTAANVLRRIVAVPRRGLSAIPSSSGDAASTAAPNGGGIGLHNVRSSLDQLDDNLLDEVKVPSFLASPRTAAILGAPMQFGQPLAGTDRGPRLLRDAGLHKVLSQLGWRVEEHGDIDFAGLPSGGADPSAAGGQAHNSGAVGEGCRRLAEEAYNAAATGRFVLTLGGDHSVALGSLSGVLRARPETCVLWVDAHADINTPATSPSGNMHGMPLAFLLGLCDPAKVRGLEWMASPQSKVPPLSPDRVAYVGLRDLDDHERRALRKMRKRGMFVSTMQDVDRQGIGMVVDRALQSIGVTTQGRPLHLSFDIDSVDPQWAPATGTVVRGGLTYREAHFVAEVAADTAQLGSMDIVEVNADLAATQLQARETVDLGLVLTASAMGSKIL